MDHLGRLEKLVMDLNDILSNHKEKVSIKIYVRRLNMPVREAGRYGLLQKQNLADFCYADLEDFEGVNISKDKPKRGRPVDPLYLSLKHKLTKYYGRIFVDIKHLDFVMKKISPHHYTVEGDFIYIDGNC
jgi:hypothetical protein